VDKILADMPISPKTVEYIRKLGIECRHLTEFKMEKTSDEEIIRFAKESGYTILTEDLDFGTILFYTQEIEPCVIILRVGNLNTTEITVAIEKRFKVSVRDEDVPNITTVKEAVALVNKLVEEKTHA